MFIKEILRPSGDQSVNLILARAGKPEIAIALPLGRACSSSEVL
jgi:hypothetical protein